MSSGDRNKIKKFKGRSVPSRFKQSAENYSSSSSGISDETVKGTGVDQTICSKTSTPAQFANSRPTFNASAIPNVTGCKPKKVQATLNSTTFKRNTLKKSPNLVVPKGPVRCKNVLDPAADDPDEVLDILYAEYQLCIFLENKAKEGMLLKSKVALEKIYEAFSYLQILIQKQKDIEKELNFMSLHLNLLEHLQKQEDMLLPFLKMLPSFEKQYNEIAVAINCVKHKLNVQDVALLDEESEGEVIQLCEGIGNLLDQILKSAGNIKSLVDSAETARMFVSTGKLTVDEIKRGYNLLSEIRNLTLSEASLKFASPLFDEEK